MSTCDKNLSGRPRECEFSWICRAPNCDCLNFSFNYCQGKVEAEAAEKRALADKPLIRTFETGATRDVDATKFDYEGFLSPLVLERYAAYMHKNRQLPDGSLRDSDNWQKGIPAEAYMKSAWRHFFEWWAAYRRLLFTGLVPVGDVIDEAICGLLFNAMGYLHEYLKAKASRQAAQGGMALNKINTRDAKHYVNIAGEAKQPR